MPVSPHIHLRNVVFPSSLFPTIPYEIPWENENDAPSSIVSVSYTHLDVYKRQLLLQDPVNESDQGLC